MDQKPLVSVVIPAYNRTDLLSIALESVLTQTYNNLEIIIIDDGSTEDIASLESMRDERIHYYRNKNHGVAYSRNYGIQMSTGKYIAFLDSDDIWLPEKIQIQVNEMEEKNAMWSQHSYYYFYDNSREKKAINTYCYRDNIKRIQYCSYKVQTSCFMVNRKAVIDNHIMFDDSRKFGEDNEFYYQMSALFPLLCIDRYLTLFRIKDSNAGKDIRKQVESRAYIYEKHKEDIEFSNNTSSLTKIAYRICCSSLKVCKRFDYDFLYKLLYLFPWLVFKIETKRLCS